MKQIIHSDERFTANHGWLLSRFSFSFAEYHDPSNVHFGHLRVLNDDVIQPSEGFGLHPHRDMEIVTYVIDGTLEHKDSLGNKGVIQAGEVQRMTAGTGIYHSEYNHSSEKPVHLLQLWIFPDQKGLAPSWEQKHFSLDSQRNRLLPVIIGRPEEKTHSQNASEAEYSAALRIHQDAAIYLSTLDEGNTVTFTQQPGRRIHLFVIRGEIKLDTGELLTAGDAARITDSPRLAVTATNESQFMLMDLS